ncbi:MAG: LamB/YcsF family protein [Kiloniellaceae bacterium]
MKININADIGEGYGAYRMGDDEGLMPLIGSANIACGMHAGDPSIMVRTIRLAKNQGVSIGAHPGFNDLWGFGRRQIRMAPVDIENLVTYQIGALQALAKANGGVVTHVKPHGALNNMAHDDPDIALAIARGIVAADPHLIFVANANSAMSASKDHMDIRIANEAYVDRRYDDNGKMLSRELPNAIIRDPEEASQQVLRLVQDGEVLSVSGKRIAAEIHTFCIHGDEPTAVPVARKVREDLDRAGISVVSLPQMV